ncbi:hypothetical protein, partial [Lysinibacillus sp. NPDC093688]|uniref:hypothetical protein n=1 Tax=Lysinibacillus sp. NPDC093688 TaxID=3390577 RepID=UPI003D093706
PYIHFLFPPIIYNPFVQYSFGACRFGITNNFGMNHLITSLTPQSGPIVEQQVKKHSSTNLLR